MTFCTNCGQQNDDMARACTNCGTPLGSSAQGGQNPYPPPPGANPYGTPQPPSSNPYGAPQPPPANPYGAPQPPPYADPYANQQQQGYGAPGYGNQPQPFGMQPGAYAGGGFGGGGLMAVGPKREPGMVILFTFLTCGIYGIWWMVTYGNEVKAALGRQDINPVTDLLIGFVTCGIWSTIAFWYKYPKLIMDMQQRVGLPPNDISTMTLLLGIFFAPASIYIIQSELNKIWDAAGGVR